MMPCWCREVVFRAFWEPTYVDISVDKQNRDIFGWKRVAKASALVLSSVLFFFLFSLQATAPLYNVKDMTTPTVLFVGAHDVLGDPADAAALKPQISNLIHYEVIPGWNHLDFLYGIDAAKILYPKILYTMEKFE